MYIIKLSKNISKYGYTSLCSEDLIFIIKTILDIIYVVNLMIYINYSREEVNRNFVIKD